MSDLEVKCPKCGHEYIVKDMWDVDFGSSEITEIEECCPECEHDFDVVVYRRIDVDHKVTEYKERV